MGRWDNKNEWITNNNTITNIHNNNNHNANIRIKKGEKKMKYNESNKAQKMTTKAEKKFMYNYWKSYFYHPLGSIDDAYKDPSYFKVQAWEYEISRAKNRYGYVMNPQVITRNTFQFSMGYEFTDVETGELCFMYITASYRRYCTLGDLEEVSKQSFE